MSGTVLVAWVVRVRLDFTMAFFTKQISDDPRLQICEGVLYFDGSPNHDVMDPVQRKRLEDLGRD